MAFFVAFSRVYNSYYVISPQLLQHYGLLGHVGYVSYNGKLAVVAHAGYHKQRNQYAV
jgi:hypothetical protein